MALTERNENDKIEIVGQYKAVQVRRADIVERDGVEMLVLFIVTFFNQEHWEKVML